MMHTLGSYFPSLMPYVFFCNPPPAIPDLIGASSSVARDEGAHFLQ